MKKKNEKKMKKNKKKFNIINNQNQSSITLFLITIQLYYVFDYVLFDLRSALSSLLMLLTGREDCGVETT